MQWGDLLDNQAISYNTLLAATEGRVFLQLGYIPASGESLTRCITAGMIRSRVEIEESPLAGILDNQLVLKRQVVPVTKTYYKLTPCSTGGVAFTRIAPLIDNQQYINYSTGERWYNYQYDTPLGPQTTIPSGYNGSIQRVVGKAFCTI
jgi:hypothetical protein